MKVDRELLQHVSDVARLNLTDREIDEFLPQLKEVLSAFSELKEVDTEGVVPSFQPVPLRDMLREDVKESSLSQKEALDGSEHKNGYFKGPRAI